MDLSGAWRAHVADDELRRDMPDPAYDDSSWPAVNVPGHWRSHPAFAAEDGPVIQRRRFEAAMPGEGRRAWLVLDGVFSQADVWLDGLYRGDTEGYFVPHAFEVTDALRAQREHLLAIETACPPQRDKQRKRSLTGAFQHSPYLDPAWNPGGIWGPIYLHETGLVRIERLRVVCVEATTERAVLALRAVLDAQSATTVRVRTEVGALVDHEAEQSLARGPNRVEWRVTVERPTLWWPRALGDASLVDVAVEVRDSASGEVSDHRRCRTGLRQVRERAFVFEVNGEHLHLKGVVAAPARMAIGTATEAELRSDLERAADAGFDLMRVHAHISHPKLYDLADEMGMLLWQDMPLYRGYARSVRTQAVRQAREAVDLLGHHPAIALWCGHDEPLALDDREPPFSARSLLKQEVPGWGKTVLDLSVHRALSRADPSRPVIAHSGVLPSAISGGTDTHVSFGWGHGDDRDLPVRFGRFPRLARFVSLYGPGGLPLLGVDGAAAEPEYTVRTPRDAYVTEEAWRAGTQAYQAEVMRRQVEELRRLKYRPNGGFLLAHLADPLDHPCASSSLFDAHRIAKLAATSVAAALRPVIVTADRLPAEVAAGDTLGLDVHVVSDLRTTIDGAVVEADLSWPGGGATWRWTGEIRADSVTRVGMIQVALPESLERGELTLRLTLAHELGSAHNEYRSPIG